jgi:cytoskeletal protein CcmA (bactofilin family)
MWGKDKMKLVKSEGGASDFGLIGRGIEIIGEITFNSQLNIEGKVKGKLVSESGTLTVGETGLIEAEVQVGACVIHGTLNGDLTAKTRVEIRRTGKVYGDVVTPILLVEEGAAFNGNIRMDRQSDTRRAGEYGQAETDDSERRVEKPEASQSGRNRGLSIK